MQQEFTLKVNNRSYKVNAEPDTPLIYVLRNDLGLKGAKLACGLDQCGACKVIIDGRAVASCQLPVEAVQNCVITTIEGIGTADNLHPLQESFIEEKAVQCGFCTSGMIITAKALFDRNPNPNDDEIRREMAGNLCRCGVYERIRRAIRRAAGTPVDQPFYKEGLHGDRDSGQESLSREPNHFLLQYVKQTPDLDSWIAVNTDGTITLFTGKVELGQDLKTSIAMIGAEELDVSLERIRIKTADTEVSPDEGYTVSSMSLETSGNVIRYATAEVRRIALSRAGKELDAPVERLILEDGRIIDPDSGRSLTYWDLFGGKRFESTVIGEGRPKGPEEYRIVGQPVGRLDLAAKVTGVHTFVQDLDLPGMIHGRVVRPPGYNARLVSADEEAVKGIPGIIRVVRDGSFLAVIAEREEQAEKGVKVLRLKTKWETGREPPSQETLYEQMLKQEEQVFHVVGGAPVQGGEIPPVITPEEAERTLEATYYKPFHMHASLGPSAAVAQLIDGKLTVWTHSQGVYPLRAAMAEVLDMDVGDIHAIHVEGPGCFGHNGADDAALDAALLARSLPGRPVSLKWTRSDENAWEPYGPATVVKMQASLNSGGDIIDWNHDVWGYTHGARPHGGGGDASDLLASWHIAKPFKRPARQPFMIPHGCIHRNADPLYELPQRRIVMHFLPDNPLRSSSLRGLGAYANVFAIESFMDELAEASGSDPVEFRLRYLADERASAVIKAASEKAGMLPEGQGRGIAFARYKNRQSYAAVLVDLSVDKGNGHVSLRRAVIAADVGQIVNPDSLRSQLEGVFVQAASWTLKEQVSFYNRGINSLDWNTYPVFRFPDAPEIDTVLLNRPGQPYLGVGEGAGGPVPAAIANALFDAAGIRLRQIPFTPDRVKEALDRRQ